jgi:hypothetical protein
MTKKDYQQLSHGLQIIFEVMGLIRRDGHSRLRAIQIVASNRKIARATVGDKCCRQLQLNAAQFDKMLLAPKMHDLRKLLNKRFPSKVEIINEFMDGILASPTKNPENAQALANQ